jgi:hypothetical protein
MPKEINRAELVYIQGTKDGRGIDMLLSIKEIEKGIARAIDPKNKDLIPENCSTCWPIDKPQSCTFWDRILFKCQKNK